MYRRFEFLKSINQSHCPNYNYIFALIVEQPIPMKNIYTCLALFFIFTLNLQGQISVTSSGTPANYTTLKQAFDAINAGTQFGIVTISITASTVEPVTAVLNASSGSANYSSIIILPTAAVTITGNINGPLITLNGAQNVTFEGRVGGIGSTISLTIQNTSVLNAATISTLQFANGASNNTLRYLDIQGSGNSNTSSTIFFSSTSATLGNSNNNISNSDIAPAGVNIPFIAISSAGSPLSNDNNSIINNRVHDFFNPAGTSSGIRCGTNSSGWTITGNSFYHTISKVSTANIIQNIIYLFSGVGYTVNNNFIGGSLPNAGGSAATYSGDFYNLIVPIQLQNLDATTVNGNTITNFNITSTPALNGAVFNGIQTFGNVNLGPITGNIIGASTGTGAITITISGNNSCAVIGIIAAGATNTIDIHNNSIGSITLNGTGSGTAAFTGISTDNASVIIQNNTIGGNTTNSIQTNTPSSLIAGISMFQNTNVLSQTSTSNTIRNLTNNGTITAAITGILSQIVAENVNTSNTITFNIITTLTSSSSNPTFGSVQGIVITQNGGFTNSSSNGNININQINNLVSASTGASTVVKGISHENGYPASLNINSNNIHTLSSAAPSEQGLLGSASIFALFGGSAGITNEGTKTVLNNGCVGTVAAPTLITGFHDGTTGVIYTETTLNIGNVTGGIFTGVPAPGTAASFAIATNALADINAAYNSISPASRPGGIDPGAGQLGGLTLTPGIYKSASAIFYITAGDLTLDGQGDPNALWIFQMSAGLTVGSPGYPRSVILKNGASAKNVYWYVGSAATINGTGGGVMVGTIITSAGVTFSTTGNAVQTVLNGRALSLNASITMTNVTINVPNTLSGSSGSVEGIASIIPSAGVMNINNNLIYDLQNTATSSTAVVGIECIHNGNANTATLSKNRIFNLKNPNGTATAFVSAMAVSGSVGSGTFNISNNMISIAPNNVQAYGVQNISLATRINLLYNSVVISGTASGNNNSGAFFRNGVSTNMNSIDNILYNTRTGGTGAHFPIVNTSEAPSSGWVSNFNDLYGSNSSTNVLWGFTPMTLAAYKTTSAQDIKTSSVTVNFMDIPSADLHLTGASVGDWKLSGLSISIPDDYDGDMRWTTPYVGADEIPFAPLPIGIVYFKGKAQGNTNLLNWKIALEGDHIDFDVQRSTDGINFSSIGKITASQQRCEQPFDFTDKNPVSGINYYRLALTGEVGPQTYSIILSILNRKAGFDLIGLYPTLVTDNALLSISSAANTMMQFVVSDVLGRIISIRTEAIHAGSSTINMNFASLPKGNYQLSAYEKGGIINTIRFVKR